MFEKKNLINSICGRIAEVKHIYLICKWLRRLARGFPQPSPTAAGPLSGSQGGSGIIATNTGHPMAQGDTPIRVTDSLTLALENRLTEVAVLFERMEAFNRRCGLSEDDAYVLTLVMEEVFTNVVRHGYPAEGGHEIKIRLELAGDVITVVFEDDARSFDPVQAAPANLDAPLEERRPGGLGVHLIKTLMDDVRYRHEGGRNVLTLKKKLQPKE